MDAGELAAFLRSRRERLHPRDVGLPTGTRRRTPGLRREEVAVAAHISTEYLTRLEQGRSPHPSAEVVAGLAAALRLTGPESDHLHALAGLVPGAGRRHRRDVRPSIRTLLDRLPATAGIVLSATVEVLAWNDLAAALMGDFVPLAPAGRNLARQAFLGVAQPDSTLARVSDVEDFRHAVVARLRAARARYPGDPAVTGLIDELRAAGDGFEHLWQRHDVDAAPMLTKTFHHPVVGDVTVDCDTLELAERDQQLVLYSARAGSTDAEALAFLGTLGGEALRTGRPD